MSKNYRLFLDIEFVLFGFDLHGIDNRLLDELMITGVSQSRGLVVL